MSNANKKPVCFRLSETTIKELNDIAKRHRVSNTDVISLLVHCFYTNDDLNSDTIEEWFRIANVI